MDLREATAMVIMDALNDNNGNIGYEEVVHMSTAKKKRLVLEMMESDEFLDRLTDAIEGAISDHLDDCADEYDIEV